MLKVFCSYGHGDDALLLDLVRHLSVLVRQQIITVWTDRLIPAGSEIEIDIRKALESANIILLLVSYNYISSAECNDIEVRALERHRLGEARVVPIILSDCDWRYSPLGQLSVLPIRGVPICSSPNKDEAFRKVVEGIRHVVSTLNGITSSLPTEDEAWYRDKIVTTRQPDFYANLNFSHTDGDGESKSISSASFSSLLSPLVDIFDDANRMLSDLEVTNQGVETVYVFDYDVFAFFINPKERSRNVFGHSTNDSRREIERRDKSIDIQSAVVTGEYLFSGCLPGQSSEKIYVSPWHREEFTRSATEILSHCRPSPGGAHKIVRQFLFRLAGLRSAIMLGSLQGQGDLGPEDRELRDDVAAIALAGASTEDQNKYLLTRLALAVIASESDLSPILQLRRILSGPFSDNLGNAESLVNLSAEFVERLGDESRSWFARLLKECGATVRPAGSLWNDASTLALVTCLSRQAEKKRRFVLVTSDRLIIAAYDRWHSSQRSEDEYVIRHVSQYSPRFQLDQNGPIFSSLHRQLEDALLNASTALELASLLKVDSERKNYHRLRMMLKSDAQQLDKCFDYLQQPESGMVNLYKIALEKLRAAWRNIERLLLGRNSDLISFRIAESLPDTTDLLPDSPISEARLEKWMANIFEDAEARVAELWVPIALKAVYSVRLNLVRERSQLESSDESVSFEIARGDERLVVAISLFRRNNLHCGRGRGAQVAVWVKRDWRSSREPVQAEIWSNGQMEMLCSEPVIVFALAAIADAKEGRWSMADRFSQLCVDAALRAPAGAVAEINIAAARSLNSLLKGQPADQE